MYVHLSGGKFFIYIVAGHKSHTFNFNGGGCNALKKKMYVKTVYKNVFLTYSKLNETTKLYACLLLNVLLIMT